MRRIPEVEALGESGWAGRDLAGPEKMRWSLDLFSPQWQGLTAVEQTVLRMYVEEDAEGWWRPRVSDVRELLEWLRRTGVVVRQGSPSYSYAGSFNTEAAYRLAPEFGGAVTLSQLFAAASERLMREIPRPGRVHLGTFALHMWADALKAVLQEPTAQILAAAEAAQRRDEAEQALSLLGEKG